MTPEEIQTAVTTAVTAALSEFGTRLSAIETTIKNFAASTDLSALKTQVTELSGKLETAKTELAAKFGDENAKLQLVATTVAKEFTRHTGRQGLLADGGGAAGAGTGGAAEPKPEDKFDLSLTKHFEATKSKTKAWQLAMSSDPAGYSAFIATKRKPAFEKSAKAA